MGENHESRTKLPLAPSVRIMRLLAAGHSAVFQSFELPTILSKTFCPLHTGILLKRFNASTQKLYFHAFCLPSSSALQAYTSHHSLHINQQQARHRPQRPTLSPSLLMVLFALLYSCSPSHSPSIYLPDLSLRLTAYNEPLPQP